MDSMRYLWQLDELLRGGMSWREAWYGGEHRGLLFLAVHLVEWLGWGLDAAISTRLTGVVVLVTLAIWFVQWSKQVSPVAAVPGPGAGGWILWLVPAAAALVAFSPAGWELWLPTLSLGGLIKNLCVVGFLVLWSREIDAAPGTDRRPWLGVLGGALILLATYGWSYALTLAALVAMAATRDWSPRAMGYRLLLAVPLVGAQLVYVLAGNGVLTRGSSVLDSGGLSALIQGVFIGSGSVLIDYGAAARWGMGNGGLMLIGLIPLAAFALQLLRVVVDGADVARRFQIAVAIFSLGNLCAAAFSRSGEGVAAAAASRYFVDYQWLVLGALGLACDTRRLSQPLLRGARSPTSSSLLDRLNRGTLVTLIVAISIGHALTWKFEIQSAGARAEYFRIARTAYLEGVRSEQDAQVLQAPFADAKRGVEVAQRYALGPFRDLRAGCALGKATFTGDWVLAGRAGERWLGRQGSIVLPGCGARVTLDIYLPPASAKRVLTASTRLGSQQVPLQPGELRSTELVAAPEGGLFRVELRLDDVAPSGIGQSVSDGLPFGALLTRIRTSSGP
jgi:hypothetical protein